MENGTWLLLVLLLLLLLLSRVHRQESHAAPPARKSPVTPDELARAVFEIGRNRDMVGFRGLFLAGAEARKALGTSAQAYLDARTKRVLFEALVLLNEAIPRDAHYGGVEVIDNQRYAMRAIAPDGTGVWIPFGKAVRVGAVYRLVEPALPGRE